MLILPASVPQLTNFSPGHNYIPLNEKKHTPFQDTRLQECLAFAKCLNTALTDSRTRANPIPPYKGALFISRFYLIRRALMPSVLVECGFMNIANDMNALASAAYRDDLADRFVNAVCLYFKK
jgi:N-acetylmuramoyl-L-alanine amidase